MFKKILKTVAFAAITLSAYNASADCLIAVQLCKPLGISKATNFYDTDALAKVAPNRCLERAREYLNWCNSQQTVGSYFYLNGVFTVGVAAYSTGSILYVPNGVGSMSPLKQAASGY